MLEICFLFTAAQILREGMSGKSSQAKGRRAEREIAGILQTAGFSARPGRAESFGAEPDVIGLDGIHLEIKRRERMALTEWLKQAEADAQRFHNGVPVVVHRGNRQGWMATMSLDSFLKLYAKGGGADAL